jgi:hypothetical protein
MRPGIYSCAFTRENIPDADLCFVKKKVDSIRASFRKELRRVRDSNIITAAATCFDELILDTEMYERSSESTHACVVKYIRARLPSQARRARLIRVWASLDRSATVTGNITHYFTLFTVRGSLGAVSYVSL